MRKEHAGMNEESASVTEERVRCWSAQAHQRAQALPKSAGVAGSAISSFCTLSAVFNFVMRALRFRRARALLECEALPECAGVAEERERCRRAQALTKSAGVVE